MTIPPKQCCAECKLPVPDTYLVQHGERYHRACWEDKIRRETREQHNKPKPVER